MTIPEARMKRLRWRCRRGTRELDALLGGWLEVHTTSLDVAQIDTFDELLQQQDPELWDWLTGRAPTPRRDWCAIIDDIRRRAGLGS